MDHREHTQLKDGRKCLIRALTEDDAQITLDNFLLTHGETEFLASYPDESIDVNSERGILKSFFESERNVLIGAFVDGSLTGTASIAALGNKDKYRHRAELGIAVAKEYWGLGIGRALMESCLKCAYRAGFSQIELEAVSENAAALGLYRSLGFTEFGRNPKGFRTRAGAWQELVYMRLEL